MTAAMKAAHILVVDDEPLTAAGLTQYLVLQGYTARTAQSVRDALASIEQQVPDIVLLDLMMPEENGIVLLQELRQDPEFQSLPVIVTSALKDSDDIVGALRAGANDYITKPVDLAILLARIERHLALSEAMAGLERQKSLQWPPGSTGEDKDACTRRFLIETLESEIHRAGRHGTELSVLVLDIHNYQDILNIKGPIAADSVLRQFIESLAGALRRSDKLCRIDTQSFCAVLPQTDEQGAVKAAGQIREWLKNISFTVEGEEISTSVSIGATSLTPTDHTSAETMLQNATDAMREASRQGSNSIFVSSPVGSPAPVDLHNGAVKA